MKVADRLADEVLQILQKRINENKLVLPPSAAVITRVMQLVRDPSFTAKEASPLFERDTVLAARVIRAANAVPSSGMDPAKSLPQAVSRLGQDKLKSLLVEASAHRLFESRDQRIVESTKGLWEHSLAVAMLSRDVAALTGVSDTEAAYVAGLLHDLGKPVVAWLLLEAEKSVVGTRTNVWIEPDVWIDVIQRTHRQVGLALADKWSMPDTVMKTIQDVNEFDSENRLSVVNCVRFANAIAKREGIYVGKVDREDADALVMIGRSMLQVDDTVLARLRGGLQDRVRTLMAA